MSRGAFIFALVLTVVTVPTTHCAVSSCYQCAVCGHNNGDSVVETLFDHFGSSDGINDLFKHVDSVSELTALFGGSVCPMQDETIADVASLTLNDTSCMTAVINLYGAGAFDTWGQSLSCVLMGPVEAFFNMTNVNDTNSLKSKINSWSSSDMFDDVEEAVVADLNIKDTFVAHILFCDDTSNCNNATPGYDMFKVREMTRQGLNNNRNWDNDPDISDPAFAPAFETNFVKGVLCKELPPIVLDCTLNSTDTILAMNPWQSSPSDHFSYNMTVKVMPGNDASEGWLTNAFTKFVLTHDYHSWMSVDGFEYDNDTYWDPLEDVIYNLWDFSHLMRPKMVKQYKKSDFSVQYKSASLLNLPFYSLIGLLLTAFALVHLTDVAF